MEVLTWTPTIVQTDRNYSFMTIAINGVLPEPGQNLEMQKRHTMTICLDDVHAKEREPTDQETSYHEACKKSTKIYFFLISFSPSLVHTACRPLNATSTLGDSLKAIIRRLHRCNFQEGSGETWRLGLEIIPTSILIFMLSGGRGRQTPKGGATNTSRCFWILVE